MSLLDSALFLGLVRVIIALAIIVPAAYYATRWYGRRHAPSQSLHIQEALSLGAGKSLYVVEWEERRLLLGVTNQSVTVLDERQVPSSEIAEGGKAE